MKPTAFFVLLFLSACQSAITDESTRESLPKSSIVDEGVESEEDVLIEDTLLKIVDSLDQPSWGFVKSAFVPIDSFPVKSNIFPLQPIVIENDTLKRKGDPCYSFPEEITVDFINKHVDTADSLAIWYEDNANYLGDGTSFEHGMYPVGIFESDSTDYYIYFVLDYLTGRGSFDLVFFVATTKDEKWESEPLGEMSYSKYNTYEFVEGEEVFKDRMVSERRLLIHLEEGKLVISHYSGDHIVGEDFDVFEQGEVVLTTEVLLK